MKIVIGYDGSATADAAVDEVLKRAWPPGTEVRIVTAVPVSATVFSAEGMALYGPVWDKARAVAREQAHGQVRKVLDRFRARPELKARELLASVRDDETEDLDLRVLAVKSLFTPPTCQRSQP